MKDADRDAEDIRTQIYLKMSPARKWEEVLRLRETAWAIRAAAIRMEHPELNDIEVETAVKKIFLYATT